MKPGPKRHTPTAELRAKVQALASFGITQAQIAAYIGIGEKALRQHYKDTLLTACTVANSAVANKLYTSATNGNVTAMIFWLKTRGQGQWDERQVYDHRSGDGSMTPAPPSVIRVVGVKS